MNIEGDHVSSKNTLKLNATGYLLLEALNADLITLNLSGVAGFQIGGYHESISFSMETDALVPDIEELFQIDETLDLALSVDFQLKFRGVNTKVGFKIHNPTKIPLIAEDLVCSIYRISNNKEELIAQSDMESCTIEAKNKTCRYSDFLLPYHNIFRLQISGFLPDWIHLKITGYFAIKNIEQRLPISISGYFDFKLLTIKDVQPN
jgi:hypothetical protein